MTIQRLRNNFGKQLIEVYGEEERLSLFYLLSEKLLGLAKVDIAMRLHDELTDKQLQMFHDIERRIEAHEPIQYIFEDTEFYGNTFKVTPSVLIPRPETEELVDWILVDFGKSKNKLQVIDIGTGSGCIAITLAKHLAHASVAALDVSQEALAIADENAKNNNVTIKTIQSDILRQSRLNEKYDIIVSNPPYVRNLEKTEMKPNVLNNEPHQALFVSDTDPLVFYRKIGQLAWEDLRSDGALYLEINQYLGKETIDLMRSIGYGNVMLRKDMSGNDRMIKVMR